MAEGTKVLDKARALIEERLAELNAETKRLEQALSNLKGERRGPGRPRSSSAVDGPVERSEASAGGGAAAVPAPSTPSGRSRRIPASPPRRSPRS